MAPTGPVKIGHKKDGRRRRPHRFHVSRPPPYPAAGSATEGLVAPAVTHITTLHDLARSTGSIYPTDNAV